LGSRFEDTQKFYARNTVLNQIQRNPCVYCNVYCTAVDLLYRVLYCCGFAVALLCVCCGTAGGLFRLPTTEKHRLGKVPSVRKSASFLNVTIALIKVKLRHVRTARSFALARVRGVDILVRSLLRAKGLWLPKALRSKEELLHIIVVSECLDAAHSP
jgi:hypothetical protein